MEMPSQLSASGLPSPSRVYNTYCQHRPTQSRPPLPRRPQGGIMDARTERSRTPPAHRATNPTSRERARQPPTPRHRSPPPLLRGSARHRGGLRGRPRPRTRNHPPAPVQSSHPPPTPALDRTRTRSLPRQRSRADTSHHRVEAAVEGSPTAGLRPPIGLCIRGVRGYTSAAGGQCTRPWRNTRLLSRVCSSDAGEAAAWPPRSETSM